MVVASPTPGEASSPARPGDRLTLRRLRAVDGVRDVLSSPAAAHGAAMVVRARERADDAPATSAFTVVANKRLGGAVERNRAKRRLREALRAADVRPGLDLVVIARTGALHMPMPELVEEARALTARLASRLGGQR